MTDLLQLKDREPKQGEQFTEPKIGGLYPIAGAFIGGAAIAAAATVAVLL